jgi:polyhydroxyalkanoate synthesis repressor PhaR
MVAVSCKVIAIAMSRLIKRYGNRKMYDTQASRYVTLDGVAELVRRGDDLRIIDNDTGEDITAVTFAQIIFEEEKRKNGLLGLPVLRWIIQQGGEAVQELLNSVDRGREALGNVRELAERRMKQLTRPAPPAAPARGRPARAGRGLLNELPQKQLEQLQHRIDAQVRSSLERVAGHPTFQNELRRIERSIKGLERQLSRLRRHQRSGTAAAPRTKASVPRKGVGL